MQSVQEKQQSAFDTLKDASGYANKMQAPRITQVVVSTGVGKIKSDKNKLKVIANGSSNGIDTSYFNPDLFTNKKKEILKDKLKIKKVPCFCFIIVLLLYCFLFLLLL